MRIAISHPGKIGDLLFALPTVRALSEQHGGPVDVYTSPYCRPVLDVLAAQSYVAKAAVLEDYVLEHTLWGAQPWQMPVPADAYDAVYHLGFREYPDRHCVAYTAHQVALPEPDPDSFAIEVPSTRIAERRELRVPYVVITGLSAAGSGSQTWSWSNDKVSDFVESCPHPVYFAGLDDERARYRCADTLTPLSGFTMLEVAEVMRGARAVITFSTGLGVLASGALHGTDVPLVCLFDGEISWDKFRLPGALTCSPDQDLSEIALRLLDPRQLEHTVARLERERRSRKIEGERTAAVLANHEQEVGGLRDGFEDAHRQLNLRNLAVEDLEKRLHQRSVAVEDLEKRLHQRSLEVEDFQKHLHERNLEAEAQRRDLADAHRTLHERNLEVAALDRKLAESLELLRERTQEVDEARRRYAEAHDALADMEMSRSWRWTRPLRMLVGESRRSPS